MGLGRRGCGGGEAERAGGLDRGEGGEAGGLESGEGGGDGEKGADVVYFGFEEGDEAVAPLLRVV